MKQSHVCPKCRGNRLLHLTQVADTAGSGQQHNPKVRTSAASRAWRLVRSLVESSEYFGPTGSQTRSFVAATGVVEAYICRSCGYTEFYTRDVGQIPVDGKVVREIAGPEPGGAYR
jgi:predicted nucleic-acid-binding Zn-ribbon protein